MTVIDPLKLPDNIGRGNVHVLHFVSNKEVPTTVAELKAIAPTADVPIATSTSILVVCA